MIVVRLRSFISMFCRSSAGPIHQCQTVGHKSRSWSQSTGRFLHDATERSESCFLRVCEQHWIYYNLK